MNLIDKYNLDNPKCKTRLQKTELVVATIAINLLSLALPVMVLQVYDRIMANHSINTLLVLTSGVCIAILFESILRITRSYTTGWSGMVYEYTMTANAMHCYINANPEKLKAEGVGKQIQDLGSFSKLRDFYSGQTLITLIDIPFALIFLILIAYIAGILVIVPLVLIIIFIFITWVLGNKLMKAIEAQDEDDDKRYNFIIETLQGIHSIKSYGVESVFQRRYEQLEENSSINNYNTSIISTAGYTLGVTFNAIMAVAVVAFGAPLVINNDLTTGALTAAILLSGRLMQPLQKMLFLWNQFQEYRIAYLKADEIFSMDQIKRSKSEKDQKKIGNIQLKDVTFLYGTKVVFDKINLDLKLPSIISIHGKNDAGKSTLLKLIAGIIEPTSGEVLIDGMHSSSLASDYLVKHVGLISADSIMFQGTIMENLTAFDSTKEKQALEIAELLHIDKDVGSLPHGYETKINDDFAGTITPGLKQRISIVRILLNKPKIILFNNADKGLDREGYSYLIKLLTMLKGKITMIITTDDYNITGLADQHYLLENQKLTPVKNDNNSMLEVLQYKELKI